jgi:hypothetical protein
VYRGGWNYLGSNCQAAFRLSIMLDFVGVEFSLKGADAQRRERGRKLCETERPISPSALPPLPSSTSTAAGAEKDAGSLGTETGEQADLFKGVRLLAIVSQQFAGAVQHLRGIVAA